MAWLLAGKYVLKARLAQASDLGPSALPYNESLITWLREQNLSLSSRISDG